MECLVVYRKIILKLIMKWDEAWITLIYLRIGQVAGYCECGNEPLCSIKCGAFLN